MTITDCGEIFRKHVASEPVLGYIVDDIRGGFYLSCHIAGSNKSSHPAVGRDIEDCAYIIRLS